ncbi:hypothetical protein FRC02_003686, partial [Tulasnella sp. 418]
MSGAVQIVEAANQLISRTATSFPQGFYYGALLFLPDMSLVRIRDYYLTEGEPSGLRWLKGEIEMRSEHPIYTTDDRPG